MNLIWLIRMKRWVQNPPPMSRVILVISVIALCLVLFAIERTIGWPDALSPNHMRR